MSSDQVTSLRDAFVQYWTPYFGGVPLLRLDGTWPSLGIVDLLTFNLRGVAELSAPQRAHLRGAAAYLACLTAECWKAAGVDVALSLDEERGIVITASGGRYLSEGQNFRVNVELELGRVLRNPPRDFPVLASFSRVISPDHNLVGLFGIGLATGLTPFGDGPWLNETPDTFQPFIEAVERVLARQCVEYYQAVFPREQLGQVGELYLNQLVYPPAVMGEPLPAQRAVRGLVRFQREFGFDEKTMLTLAANLARSPDELLSCAGLAYYAAATDGRLAPEVIAAAQIKGAYVGLLRRPMLEVREALGRRADWITQEERLSEDEVRFDVEIRLGFLPWIVLPRRKALLPKNRPILDALAHFDYQRALSLLDSAIGESPGEIELRLQRASLLFLTGEFDAAHADLRELLAEPGCEENSQVLNQIGLCELTMGLQDDAATHLRLAYRYRDAKLDEPHKVANDYAWSLILAERFAEALPVLEEALATDPCPVTTLLNKAFALRSLGREAELVETEKRLLDLAPTDRRVFGNAVLQGFINSGF